MLFRLGVVLLTTDSAGESSLLILGRQPLLDPRPPEFQDASQITLELAASCVDTIAKDVLGTTVENPFARLNERWRWNLY